MAILAWLLHVGEDPPASDLLVVTGVSKGPVWGTLTCCMYVATFLCCVVLNRGTE